MFVSQDVAKTGFSQLTGKPKSDLYMVGAPSALVAGFFAAACSLPLDMVKTRMQKMRPNAEVRALPAVGTSGLRWV
jgi:hypothetical protein